MSQETFASSAAATTKKKDHSSSSSSSPLPVLKSSERYPTTTSTNKKKKVTIQETSNTTNTTSIMSNQPEPPMDDASTATSLSSVSSVVAAPWKRALQSVSHSFGSETTNDGTDNTKNMTNNDQSTSATTIPAESLSKSSKANRFLRRRGPKQPQSSSSPPSSSSSNTTSNKAKGRAEIKKFLSGNASQKDNTTKKTRTRKRNPLAKMGNWMKGNAKAVIESSLEAVKRSSQNLVRVVAESEDDAFDSDDDMRRIYNSVDQLSGLSSSFQKKSKDQPNDGSSNSKKRVIVVGPLLDFLTADATLCMFACMAIAVYFTLQDWSIVVSQGQVPLRTVATWVLLSYSIGQVVSNEVFRYRQVILPTSTSLSGDDKEGAQRRHDERVQEAVLQAQKRNRHSILVGALSRSGAAKIKFQSVQRQLKQEWRKGRAKAWSNLNSLRQSKTDWERTCDPTKEVDSKNSVLVGRLLKNPSYRRIKKKTLQEHIDNNVPVPPELVDEHSKICNMGHISAEDIHSLDEFMIVPMMRLRGMDVFLTDDPESEISTHPWLIMQGLRDVPTAVVNIVTQWANIVIYFEMPSWVQDFNNLVEKDDDPDDVKALKRFLNGDDDYKNSRMKMIPSVTDGPLAVRMLAPPKRELVVACELLPITWRKHEAKVDAHGRKLHPAFECELDCMTNKAIRVMTGIFKRNIGSLAVDVAAVIQKPEGSDEEEPEACIGMFRMNKIDVASCPKLPDRYEHELPPTIQSLRTQAINSDVARASTIVKMDSAHHELLASAS